MDNITFKDKFLYKNNQVITEFKSDIKEILIFNKLIIILLDMMNNCYGNKNVFCLNDLGQVIWQVPKYDYIYKDSPFVEIFKVDDSRYKIILEQIKRIKEFDPYFSFEFKEDISKLAWLHNWDSTYIIIDVQTGEVLIDPNRSMYGRRPW